MKNVQQNSRRWAGILGMICLLAVTLTSCLKNNNDTTPLPPAALVSVINASPDSTPLDFYLDANKANAYPIPYANGLDYIRAYTGKRTAAFKLAGSTTVVKSDTATLAEDKFYTVILSNVVGSADLTILKDTIAKPADGKAALRFINLSADAPAVDLAVKAGAVLVANKAYKAYSSFLPVDANSNYTFEVRQAGTTTVLATLTGVPLYNGSIYTVWLQGISSATDTKKPTINIQRNAFY